MAKSMFYKMEAQQRVERGYRMMVCIDAETLDSLIDLAKIIFGKKIPDIEKTEAFSDLRRNVDDFVFHSETISNGRVFIEIENKLPEHKLEFISK